MPHLEQDLSDRQLVAHKVLPIASLIACAFRRAGPRAEDHAFLLNQELAMPWPDRRMGQYQVIPRLTTHRNRGLLILQADGTKSVTVIHQFYHIRRVATVFSSSLASTFPSMAQRLSSATALAES
jgi:hypothetical protein